MTLVELSRESHPRYDFIKARDSDHNYYFICFDTVLQTWRVVEMPSYDAWPEFCTAWISLLFSKGLRISMESVFNSQYTLEVNYAVVQTPDQTPDQEQVVGWSGQGAVATQDQKVGWGVL